MIGYLFMDTIDFMFMVDFSISFILYIVLAMFFVVDALIHIMIRYSSDEHFHSKYGTFISYKTVAAFACIADNIASISYMIGAIFSGNERLLDEVVSYFNLIGSVGFLMEACLSMFGWYIVKHNEHSGENDNLHAYAYGCSVVGALLYSAAAVLNFFVELRIVRLTQIGGDVVYLIDSILFCACWYRLKQKIELKALEVDEEDYL
ncbi:unnamed protein product [Didymodactylos carnosus]|uniref:Uncharacterized protein n=1 Tax=Didymodactylos carnosus TaxID=1234261 RepID=A0A813R3M2_9BILA|nr:unnamed protein product [Didymodactylos carnosus]CAF3558169.1 unnamed protein product [Didymodactylos carnosus]